jgi:hypothetical protein
MYLYLKCSVKGGTQNTNYKIINQNKNVTCHVQSLEKDFYLGTLGSFDYVFTQESMWLSFFFFFGGVECCANVAMLEKGTPSITKSFKVIWNHISLWGIV